MFSFKFFFLIGVLLLEISNVYCKPEDSTDSLHHGHFGPMFFFKPSVKAEFGKCLDESGMTKDDLNVDSPPKEPTTQQMCFAKCLATASGALGKNGQIMSDVIKKNAPPHMDESTLNTAITCFEAAGKISSCEDMAKLMKCVPKPPQHQS